MTTSTPPSKVTRGKTAAGRLRLVDEWLCHRLTRAMPSSLHVVDVGFGETPSTSLDWRQALLSVGVDAVDLLATDTHARRVEDAQHHAASDVRFACDGFDLPSVDDNSVDVVRAMNVLRQYAPDACAAVHQQLAAKLKDGGLLLEGTSDKFGDLVAFHVFRRRQRQLQREALVFCISGQKGFGPWQLRDVLPQDVRRQVRPQTLLHSFFSTWTEAARTVRTPETSHVEVFAASVQRLIDDGVPIESRTSFSGVSATWSPTTRASPDALLRVDVEDDTLA